MAEIKLGMKVRDVVTKFTGIVTGVVTYLTDCKQALIVPPVGKDGKLQDGAWIDMQRLEILDQPINLINKNPGFDKSPNRKI